MWREGTDNHSEKENQTTMRALDEETLTTLIGAAMRSGDWAEAERLGQRLDRLPRPQPVATVAAALWYAEQGLRIFPLQPQSKIPHKGTRGCLEATNDPAQIEAWWRRWPDSNVAIATGHLVDVIDIDGPVGVKSWAAMSGLPPILGTVSTPRHGGNHLYIAALGLSNKAGLAPGIDIRGAGGYVVAPPSVNADGVLYRWRRPLALPLPTSECTVELHTQNGGACFNCCHRCNTDNHQCPGCGTPLRHDGLETSGRPHPDCTL